MKISDCTCRYCGGRGGTWLPSAAASTPSPSYHLSVTSTFSLSLYLSFYLSLSICLSLSVFLSLSVLLSLSVSLLSLFISPPLTVLPSLSLTKTNEQDEESAIFLQAITLKR